MPDFCLKIREGSGEVFEAQPGSNLRLYEHCCRETAARDERFNSK